MNEKLRKYAHESEVLQNKLNQQQFGYEKFISDDSKDDILHWFEQETV